MGVSVGTRCAQKANKQDKAEKPLRFLTGGILVYALPAQKPLSHRMPPVRSCEGFLFQEVSMARKITPKLSARLDYAVYMAEKRGGIWRLYKRLVEWFIFGGGS